MEIRLKKKAAPPPDRNAAIKSRLIEAAAKMEAKQYAAARAIYEDLAVAASAGETVPSADRAHVSR